MNVQALELQSKDTSFSFFPPRIPFLLLPSPLAGNDKIMSLTKGLRLITNEYHTCNRFLCGCGSLNLCTTGLAKAMVVIVQSDMCHIYSGHYVYKFVR